MSKISAKSAETQWKTLYSVTINESNKTIGHKKCISLKQLVNDAVSDNFILADIRAFLNGKPTTCGVCLTPYEFDWLAKTLLYSPNKEQILHGKETARILTVRPKVKRNGVEIIQQVNDQTRRLNLYKTEIKQLTENYGTFYNLIEEFEENEVSSKGEME